MKFTKYIILVTLLSLNGCGFHLRAPHPNTYDKIALNFVSTCPRFQNQLRSYFQSYNIEIYDYHAQNTEHAKPSQVPLLKIGCPDLSEQPLVYDGEGQLRRERLKLRLTATLNHHKNFALEITRERQLNSNQSLGDSAEKNMIIHEMQEALLYKLLTHISK